MFPDWMTTLCRCKPVQLESSYVFQPVCYISWLIASWLIYNCGMTVVVGCGGVYADSDDINIWGGCDVRHLTVGVSFITKTNLIENNIYRIGTMSNRIDTSHILLHILRGGRNNDPESVHSQITYLSLSFSPILYINIWHMKTPPRPFNKNMCCLCDL